MISFYCFITDPASCGGPVSIYPGAPGFSEAGGGPCQREDSSQGGWRGRQTGRRVGAEQSPRDCRVRARNSHAKLDTASRVSRELNLWFLSPLRGCSWQRQTVLFKEIRGAAVVQQTTSVTWARNGSVPKAIVLVKAYTLVHCSEVLTRCLSYAASCHGEVIIITNWRLINTIQVSIQLVITTRQLHDKRMSVTNTVSWKCLSIDVFTRWSRSSTIRQVTICISLHLHYLHVELSDSYNGHVQEM